MEDIVNKAIQQVVFTYNAYAPIISSFRIVYSDIVPTMGVDKYARLIINPDFAEKNKDYMRGLIIHETLHIFFGHTGNARGKIAFTDDAGHNKRANIAADCAINQYIKEPLPEGAITPSVLQQRINKDVERWQSAEYYYDLLDNSPNNEMCSTDIANSQQVQDELDRMGIEHVSEEEVNDKVIDTAKEMCKSRGSQYGSLVDFARELLDPKVDWRPLLQATLRNAEKKIYSIHEKQTYKRVSRRSTNILIPKRHGNKITVTLSFDTSGSITQKQVNQFLSEVQSCMRYSEIKECALWHTDNYWYGTPDELEKNIEHVFETGGTDEACMGKAEQHVKADLHIHFSDGCHGDNYGFEHPQKNIEIVWDDNNIKEIRRF